MSEMEMALLSNGLIMLLFVALWIIQYPRELRDSLLLRGCTTASRIYSIIVWIFVISASLTVSVLFIKLIGAIV